MAAIEKVLEDNLVKAAEIIEDQLDSEIQKLDNLDDGEIDAIHKKRLEALKKQAKQKQEWIHMGHGEYTELANEKEFFDACTRSPNFVCHFYRESTFRCKIVDKHFNILAKKHPECRFVKLHVEKAPFLTDKLRIRVLPTIALCNDAKTKDFIIGFDDFGGIDEFETEMMEWRIAQTGIIKYSGDLLRPPDKKSSKPHTSKPAKTVRGGPTECDSDDD